MGVAWGAGADAGDHGVVPFRPLYPDRPGLGRALARLLAHGVELDGASDHGVSEALYLHDPDGNGIELYWDRPEAQWPRTADGQLRMGSAPLDLPALLRAGPGEVAASSPALNTES